MTQTIQIDTVNYDIMRGTDGNLSIISAADAVGQNCITAIRAQKSEMQYAMQDGMPTFEVAFQRNRPQAFAANARRIINGVTGVVRVTAFNIAASKNTLVYNATIETIYGTTFIQGTA